jgi:signal transduction histidine kinase
MRNKLESTARPNIKVISVVALFLMLIVTAYSQWVSLQDSKKDYAEHLAAITDFLVRKMPADSFVEIAERQGVAEKTVQEQVIAINKEIQPILANILVPDQAIKFGVYSRYHEKIIAIGPDFDNSLLSTIPFCSLTNTQAVDSAWLGEQKNSIEWYGAPTLYHLRLINNNGKVIGYVFASINLNIVYAKAFKKTLTTFLGGFIALMIAIILFQEVFIRLKKDLKLFAEEIVKGRAKHFESKLPELTPVLKYISQQTENMARLDRLNIIGEMAASIAHEVRNPMTTVRGFLQYLGNKEQFKDSKEHFTLMIDELDRANHIITEFLSLAKNKTMNFQNTNLNKVITEILPLIQADALRYSCQVETSLDVIPIIVLDENSIRQLILNIVRNAIEAMPQGGTISISTVYWEQKVLLFIKDQGIGIPSELLDELGTPFVTTKESGTGLGLAVCYRIAQRHGATISVESKPRQGTIFTIGFKQG